MTVAAGPPETAQEELADAPESGAAAPRTSLVVRVLLLVLPVAAALSIWLSPSPGAANQFYLYRTLVIGLAAPAVLWNLLRWRRTGVANLWLALAAVAVGWSVVIMGRSLDAESGQRQVIASVLALAGASMLVVLTRPWRVRYVRVGMVVALVAMLGMGVVEWRSGVSWETRVGRPWNYPGALGGGFVNPNNYASFLVAFSVPLFVALRSGARALVRFGAFALLLATAVVSSQTASRTAWVLLGVMGVVTLLWSTGRRRPVGTGSFLALAGLAIAALLGAGATVRDRVADAFGEGAEASDAVRTNLARAALRYFVESGGIGIGPGNYIEFLRRDVTGTGGVVTNAHNTYLQIIAEYGVVWVVPMLVLVWVLARRGLRGWASGEAPGTRLLRLELVLMIIGISAGAIAASGLLMDPAWWLLFGYAVAVAGALEAHDTAPPADGSTRGGAS